MTRQYPNILSRIDVLYENGDNLIDVVLQQAASGDSDALFLLREGLAETQELFLRAKQKGIRYPEIVNLFTGTPLCWTWQRTASTGALEQLIFFAAIIHAVIIRASGPQTGTAQRLGFALSRDTLTRLMRFIATDPEIEVGKPFPYSQEEMRRSFEEHAPNIEKAWG